MPQTALNGKLDISETKIVDRRSQTLTSNKTIEEDKAEGLKPIISLGDEVDGMNQVMMDSNRPRDEWNISQVKVDEKSQPSLNTNAINKQIVTTHEEEFVALNNVLKDHLPQNAASEDQELILFPSISQKDQNSDQVNALLADDMLI